MADQATKPAATPIAEKLATLNDTALDGLWGSVDREISRRRIAEQREALREDRLVAERRREALEARKASRPVATSSKTAAAPDVAIGARVYRSPDDSMQIWRGMGRRPKWLTAALSRKGVTLDSLKSTWTAEDARAAARLAEESGV